MQFFAFASPTAGQAGGKKPDRVICADFSQLRLWVWEADGRWVGAMSEKGDEVPPWERNRDPFLSLYLDPSLGVSDAENTVAEALIPWARRALADHGVGLEDQPTATNLQWAELPATA